MSHKPNTQSNPGLHNWRHNLFLLLLKVPAGSDLTPSHHFNHLSQVFQKDSIITLHIDEVFLRLNAPGTDQYKYVKQVWENSSIDINRTQHLISTSETQSLALNIADLNAQRTADKKEFSF